MRIYEEKQIKNQHELNQRKQQAYKSIPELKEIDQQIASTSIQLTKLIIEGTSDTKELVNEIKEKNFELSMKKIELLHVNGFPKNYLQKIYNCPICKDTGYTGKSKCVCFKQTLIDLAYEQSNIRNILEEENFSSFSFNYYSDKVDLNTGISPLQNIKSVYDYCIQFVENFNTHYKNIIFYGNSGVGKTFLSNCIAKEVLDKGNTVIYLTSFQLFEVFEKNKFNRMNEEEIAEDLVGNILTCDLLIIDDLGTEFNTTLTNSQLFNCLNTKLISKKSNIISKNLIPQKWSKQYSSRIVSRIFGNYEPLKIIGEDIRVNKAFG